MSTLKTSAAIFTDRQIEKMIILSYNEYSLANAVAVPSQNRKTFGLRVLRKKPGGKDSDHFGLAEFYDASCIVLKFDFFEEDIKHAHDNEETTADDAQKLPVLKQDS